MDYTYWHLVLNHLPTITPIIGLLILIGAWVARNETAKQIGYLVLLFGAISAFPSSFTGEQSEEIVEHLPDFDSQRIHAHEEAAETFVVMCYILGAAALLCWWASWKKKAFANMLGIALLLYLLVVLFFARRTGTSGGEIRHPEIRTDNSITPDRDGD
ncbi:MAG: hypothetical protein IT273_02105 [Chitinophagales bacterium]|nr:hypothetical protein [Chitinophagales bacterium]